LILEKGSAKDVKTELDGVYGDEGSCLSAVKKWRERLANESLILEEAVEPALVFAELFEGLQIIIDPDQKMAICPLRC
jgi:hypothetical protein